MWKNVLITDVTANFNEIGSIDSEVKYGSRTCRHRSMNFIQTSHKKTSLKVKIFRAKGHNYYFETEVRKSIILYHNSMKRSQLNRRFIYADPYSNNHYLFQIVCICY